MPQNLFIYTIMQRYNLIIINHQKDYIFCVIKYNVQKKPELLRVLIFED